MALIVVQRGNDFKSVGVWFNGWPLGKVHLYLNANPHIGLIFVNMSLYKRLYIFFEAWIDATHQHPGAIQGCFAEKVSKACLTWAQESALGGGGREL